MAAWRMDVSSSLTWRAPAAEALFSLGEGERAAALLAEGTDRKGPDALSAAERRVVRLVRRGLGNREIAEELFVTASTVEQHLTRAYRKLGVRGRAELAAVPETTAH
ncbi:helix-turn-helix transcriptional regulator [Actinocorallia libanotica]|uniref:HTH luxR-type domain-containing protein n=1 Tax=Actinocorallia libanotica TaxID=46162 RepID=A0ABP4C565_9ACTN